MLYALKVQAARAYDAAVEQEASRLKLPVSRMPRKTFRLRPCGKSYGLHQVACGSSSSSSRIGRVVVMVQR